MDINTELMEALKFCSDPISLPDKPFGSLLEKALKTLAGQTATDDDISGSGVDAGIAKHAFSTIIGFTLEAAKSASDNATISSKLDECQWGPDRIQFYTNAFEEYKSKIEMELGRIGNSHPHIVDTKWRLDYYIKDNFLEKVNKPTYLISLKTQVPGEEKLKNVEFACSIEQLQDLVSKLKDATKTLEKAAQM